MRFARRSNKATRGMFYRDNRRSVHQVGVERSGIFAREKRYPPRHKRREHIDDKGGRRQSSRLWRGHET